LEREAAQNALQTGSPQSFEPTPLGFQFIGFAGDVSNNFGRGRTLVAQLLGTANDAAPT
jgi:hypothetical protein